MASNTAGVVSNDGVNNFLGGRNLIKNSQSPTFTIYTASTEAQPIVEIAVVDKSTLNE